MPVHHEERQTPRGEPYLHLITSGTISLADARQLGALVAPDSKYCGWKILALATADAVFTAEARKYLPTLRTQYSACASVVDNLIVRAALKIMIRVAGDVGRVRLFSGVDEALAWLDSLD